MGLRNAISVAGGVLALLGTGCGRAVCDASETGRRLSYAGHEIYYEVRGQGSRTLVLIHGWTGSLETWKYQLDAFSQHRRVAIDLPGGGRSSKREECSRTMPATRDVVVDHIAVNDVIHQAEAQTNNTAAWGNGKCGGGQSTEWIHCNGYIGFSASK